MRGRNIHLFVTPNRGRETIFASFYWNLSNIGNPRIFSRIEPRIIRNSPLTGSSQGFFSLPRHSLAYSAKRIDTFLGKCSSTFPICYSTTSRQFAEFQIQDTLTANSPITHPSPDSAFYLFITLQRDNTEFPQFRYPVFPTDRHRKDVATRSD